MTERVELHKNERGGVFITMQSSMPSQGIVSSGPIPREDLVSLYDQIIQQLNEWGCDFSIGPQLSSEGQAFAQHVRRAIQLDDDEPLFVRDQAPPAPATVEEWRVVTDRAPRPGDILRVLEADGALRDTTVGRTYAVVRVNVSGSPVIRDNVNDTTVARIARRGVQWQLVECAPPIPAEIPLPPAPAEEWRVVTNRDPVVGDFIRVTSGGTNMRVGDIAEVLHVTHNRTNTAGVQFTDRHGDTRTWYRGYEIVERVTPVQPVAAPIRDAGNNIPAPADSYRVLGRDPRVGEYIRLLDGARELSRVYRNCTEGHAYRITSVDDDMDGIAFLDDIGDRVYVYLANRGGQFETVVLFDHGEPVQPVARVTSAQEIPSAIPGIIFTVQGPTVPEEFRQMFAAMMEEYARTIEEIGDASLQRPRSEQGQRSVERTRRIRAEAIERMRARQ